MHDNRNEKPESLPAFLGRLFIAGGKAVLLVLILLAAWLLTQQ